MCKGGVVTMKKRIRVYLIVGVDIRKWEER